MPFTLVKTPKQDMKAKLSHMLLIQLNRRTGIPRKGDNVAGTLTKDWCLHPVIVIEE